MPDHGPLSTPGVPPQNAASVRDCALCDEGWELYQTETLAWYHRDPEHGVGHVCIARHQPEQSAASGSERRKYPTELVDCDRCDGMGEVEDDLWVWTRCYSCWGSGQIEVCAYCLDTGEECDACGC